MFQNEKTGNKETPKASLNASEHSIPIYFKFPILLRFAIILFSILGLSTVWLILSNPRIAPIQHVNISGDISTHSQHSVKKIISPFIQKSFWTLNVSALQHTLKTCDWIEEVSLKRVWPDTLKIHIIARTPIAYMQFNKEGDILFLIDKAACIFENQQYTPKQLPYFIGTKEDAELLVCYYKQLQKMLELRALFIKSVRIDEQKRLFVELYNGIRLLLGNSQPIEQIMRLLEVSPDLLHQSHKIKSIDLRYSNGVAIKKRVGLT